MTFSVRRILLLTGSPLRTLVIAFVASQVDLPGVGVVVSSPCRAATSRIFTASDLPRLGRGIVLPEAGNYRVRVWASGSLQWSASVEGQEMTLALEGTCDDPAPRWQEVGHVTIVVSEPFRLRVAGVAVDPKPMTITGNYQSGQRKVEGDPLARVPALIALSNDPDFDPLPAVDVLRGRLDTDTAPDDPRRSTVRTNHQGVNFQAPSSLEQWREQAEAIRQRILVSVGLWPTLPRTPLNPEVYGKAERDGYTIEKVVLETIPGFYLAGNLYRPAGDTATGEQRRPAILCPHGHYADGRVNPEVQARCIQWARLGCVVFVYDMVGYNDSKPFGHGFLNDRLRRWGLSLVTLQTWNSLRALDWVRTLPDVDAARVACTGSSGGGTQTFLLTAIDDRVRAAAPVVMVSDSFQGGCTCENCAGLRLGLDNVAIAALTAPRPLKLVGATGDWTAKTLTNVYPAIRTVYDLFGVPDRISAEVFDFPHNYNRTSREAVYAFLAPRLIPGLDSEDTREAELTPEDPADLFAFNEEHPHPTTMKTPEQLEEELVGVVRRQLDALAPGTQATSWQAARELLATSHRVRLGLDNPSGAEIVATPVRQSRRRGVAIEHVEISLDGQCGGIPAVRLTPSNPTGRVVVLLAARGKAVLVNAQGGWTPLVRALLDEGLGVVGFDPLFVGESIDPNAYVRRRPETVHFDTYNPSLAVDRLQDLATVIAWARTLPEVHGVSLVGVGRWGPLALLALPVLEGLDRVSVTLSEFSYGDGSGRIPEDLDLPGVLQFGGLAGAAALAAPRPLWLQGADEGFEAAWPEKAYRLAGSEAQLRIDAKSARPRAIALWLKDGRRPGD